MAIRFLCSACSQPIEADDTDALKQVVCYYCRKTVTVPRETMLPELSQIPVARPAASHSPEPIMIASPRSLTVVGASTKRLSITAMILVFAALVMLIGYFFVMAPYKAELLEMQKALTRDGWPAALRAQEAIVAKPGGATAMILGVSLEAAAILCWIAALVCAIIAVVREQYDRRFAITTLIMVGLSPIIVCCGGAALSGIAGA